MISETYNDESPQESENELVEEPYSKTVQEYISPVMVLLTLMSVKPNDDECIAVVFDHIPLRKRHEIKKLCKSNFKVHMNRKIKKIHFDKLVFSQPRGMCRGVRLVLGPIK